MGEYREVHYHNKENTENYDHRIFSFVRWSNDEKLIVISNFDTERSYDIDFKLPPELITTWELEPKDYALKEQLYGVYNPILKIEDEVASMPLKIAPLESFIFKLND